jgi:hypothetical protein
MKSRILSSILILLSSQGIQAATPTIEGAFGIKLGDTLNADFKKGEVYTKLGTLFFIDPPVKNEHFNEYAVLITKTTNKIHSIYAEKEQKTVNCKAELLKVKMSLEKLYGVVTEKDKIYSVKQMDREINLTCKVSKINADNASLQIKYVDHKIDEEGRVKSKQDGRDQKGL